MSQHITQALGLWGFILNVSGVVLGFIPLFKK